MKFIPKFKARINDKGGINFDNRVDFDNYVSSKFKAGDEVNITIEKYRDKRSLKANRYYWLVLNFIAKEIGYNDFEVYELHCTFKKMFLPMAEKKDVFTGEVFETIASTRNMKSDEFSNYLNEVIMYATKELNLIIPSPGDISY